MSYIYNITLSESFVKSMLIIVVIMLLVISFLTRQFWKAVLCYSLIAILLPAFSGPYTLLFLLLPFFEFLNYTFNENSERINSNRIIEIFYLLLMALIIIPWGIKDLPKFSQQYMPFSGGHLIYFHSVVGLLCFVIVDELLIRIKNKKVVVGGTTVVVLGWLTVVGLSFVLAGLL